MKKLWRKIAALGMAAVMTVTAVPAVNANAEITVYSGDLERISKGRYADGTTWVYELLDREPVWRGDRGLGAGYGIDPVYAEVEICTAPSTITYTTDPSKLPRGPEENGGAVLKKSDGSLTLPEGGTPVTVYLADKKTPVDLKSGYPCYVVEENFDPSVIFIDQQASFEGGYLKTGFADRFVITPREKGKTTIVVQSPISGKKVKINVIVK